MAGQEPGVRDRLPHRAAQRPATHSRTTATADPVEPTSLGLAKDEFGPKGLTSLAFWVHPGALGERPVPGIYVADWGRLSGALPPSSEKTRCSLPPYLTGSATELWNWSFDQLDRRWEHLRVRHSARQRRLLASLAEAGQQTPIVVVAAEGSPNRYVVIDGYKRIAALGTTGPGTR